MYSSLKTYLSANPTILQATAFLRLVFVFSFGLQLLIALSLSIILFMLVPGRNQNPLLAQIMLVLSFLQLPFALLISHLVTKARTRQAYLSASIMSGVLLSTPAWFASMAFLSTPELVYVLIFLVILIAYYVLGLVLCGRWGKQASLDLETPNRLKTPATQPPANS